MADQRLEVLMKNTQAHYSKGSPIILEAHALYLDKATNNCIAQLKWRSIDSHPIKAVMIEIAGFDAFDQALEPFSYQYDRLQVTQGKTFGEKTPITIPSNTVVRFNIAVKAVSFVEGKMWEGNDLLSALPEPKKAEMRADLYEQYKRDLRKSGCESAAKYEPQQFDGLWRCGCGSWQFVGNKCLNCGASWDSLQDTADESILETHLEEFEKEQIRLHKLAEEERLAKEAAEAERQKALMKQRAAEEEAARIEAAKKKKKTIIASITGTLLVVLFACYMLILKPMLEYNSATDLLKLGQYDEATIAFEKLGDYSNSATQAKESQYQKGISLMNAGDYVSAYFTLSAIRNYSDIETLLSSDQQFINIQECYSRYQKRGSIVTLGYGTYYELSKYSRPDLVYCPPELDLTIESSGEEKGCNLEWIVLSFDAESNRALILSRYVFGENRDFDTNDGYSWSSSSIRQWLNSDFYNDAFSDEEKATIIQTYSTGASDNVFLLSKDEVDTYLSDDVIGKRASRRSAEEGKYSDWWLRSGSYSSVHQVTDYDSIYSTKYPSLGAGVRPALWVDVHSAIRVNQANYQKGKTLLSEKNFDEATKTFIAVGLFGDASSLAPESQYQKAEALYTAKEFDNAARVFYGIVGYKDSLDRAKESLYQNAISKINTGDFESAYDSLVLIPGYADVDQLLKSNQGLIQARKTRFSTVGNIVRFGHYEQDGVSTNGKEDIKWIVLAYDATTNKALLLSKYILDDRQFGEKRTSTSYKNYGKRLDPIYPGWADSSVRKWINNTFITNAFSTEEQSQISTTTVSTPDYKYYDGSIGASGGPNTQDKVFLLSSEEVKKYVKNSDTTAAPTQYAVQQGTSTYKYEETTEGLASGSWWFRNPRSSSEAYMQYNDGLLYADVDFKEGIRPALWINLQDDYSDIPEKKPGSEKEPEVETIASNELSHEGNESAEWYISDDGLYSIRAVEIKKTKTNTYSVTLQLRVESSKKVQDLEASFESTKELTFSDQGITEFSHQSKGVYKVTIPLTGLELTINLTID